LFIVPVVAVIIIKTGNWDFGKLKGGDNEFHSLVQVVCGCRYQKLLKADQLVWHFILDTWRSSKFDRILIALSCPGFLFKISAAK
jgi:hypothetical protein